MLVAIVTIIGKLFDDSSPLIALYSNLSLIVFPIFQFVLFLEITAPNRATFDLIRILSHWSVSGLTECDCGTGYPIRLDVGQRPAAPFNLCYS